MPKGNGDQQVQDANPAAAQAGNLTVKWDDSNMKSSYANVCNVASTRPLSAGNASQGLNR